MNHKFSIEIVNNICELISNIIMWENIDVWIKLNYVITEILFKLWNLSKKISAFEAIPEHGQAVHLFENDKLSASSNNFSVKGLNAAASFYSGLKKLGLKTELMLILYIK